MITTPKKTTVDLSKAKIGQKVRLACGEIAELVSIRKSHKWPFEVQWRMDARITSHVQNGRFWPEQPSDSDIVAILPLPKKAAKSKPAQSDVLTLTSLFAKIAFSNDPAWVKRAIKALQFIQGGKKA